MNHFPIPSKKIKGLKNYRLGRRVHDIPLTDYANRLLMKNFSGNTLKDEITNQVWTGGNSPLLRNTYELKNGKEITTALAFNEYSASTQPSLYTPNVNLGINTDKNTIVVVYKHTNYSISSLCTILGVTSGTGSSWITSSGAGRILVASNVVTNGLGLCNTVGSVITGYLDTDVQAGWHIIVLNNYNFIVDGVAYYENVNLNLHPVYSGISSAVNGSGLRGLIVEIFAVKGILTDGDCIDLCNKVNEEYLIY